MFVIRPIIENPIEHQNGLIYRERDLPNRDAIYQYPHDRETFLIAFKNDPTVSNKPTCYWFNRTLIELRQQDPNERWISTNLKLGIFLTP